MTSAGVEVEPAQDLVHGEALGILREFAADLGEFGELFGLLGPREYERLWTRHLLNSAVVAPFFSGMNRIADVGSGAGLPGIVLAAMLPDVECHLIEPMERRARWLSDESARLGLANVVVHARSAQEAPIKGSCDGVTSRAVSALRTLIPMSAPLVKDGGRLALIKGKSVSTELDAARQQIRKANLVDVEIRVVGEGVIPEATTVLLATVKG